MKRRNIVAFMMASVVAFGGLTACGSQEQEKSSENKASEEEGGASDFEGVTLTLLNQAEVTPDGVIDEACKVAEKKFGFKISIEDAADENVVKTRLATGDCPDLLIYNTGSLLSSLNPSQYFIDLTNTDMAATFDDSFIKAASVDGVLYGIPQSDSTAAGFFYNKELYEEYNLEVPTTWAEFKNNLDILQNAGIDAMGISLVDWTSQLPFLGDNYQLLHDEPDFAEKFTAGETKFSTSKAGLRSWEKFEELVPYFNEDAASVKSEQIPDRLLKKECGHMMHFTSQIATWIDTYGEEELDSLGFFCMPGDTEEQTGLTVWPSNAIYGKKDGKNTEAIMAFLEWYASDEGLDALTSFYEPSGGFHTGYQTKETKLNLVKEVQQYYSDQKTAPALEYLTPIKGANCPQICGELGSGQTTAKEAAESYDQDCEKAAMQLGLWK